LALGTPAVGLVLLYTSRIRKLSAISRQENMTGPRRIDIDGFKKLTAEC